MLITFALADVIENCSECIHPIMGTARYRKLRYLMCLVTIATALAEFEINIPIYKNLPHCKKMEGGNYDNAMKIFVSN
jgi:hypothetical protein